MKAGRELDAVVHENVMGIAWDESRCRICGCPLAVGADIARVGCVVGNCSLRPTPAERADAPPRYSEDIADAFLVVEKLLATSDRNGDLLLAVVVRVENKPREALCTIVTMRSEDIEAYADTAALAICLAARKAVGVTGAE